jgi:hypothetical protein
MAVTPPTPEQLIAEARFRLVSADGARAQALPGVGKWTNDYSLCLYDFSVEPPSLVATDEMQPEDANFFRDLAYVPRLLNELNDALTAALERIKELEKQLTS